MNLNSPSKLANSDEWRGSIHRNRDLALILALGGILVAILVPLPGPVMDALLGVNIAVSVLILLTVVYLRGPLEFAAFPSMLLIATLYRLALNIATTRLILSNAGTEGPLAAGKVVNYFGDFVSGSNVVVGFIIFSVLVLIQFMVVTKGASRIAEVAARFSLDRMPGAQMAIDADLTAGNITSSEARLAREDLALQADFYGAMDGASKFVRGDAIAAVLITSINIFFGIGLGVISYGMDISEAVAVFATLTIGDGIATQLPALFISVAAALMVTRASSRGQVGHALVGQVFANPRALFITAMILFLLGFVGLSPLALGTLAVGLLAVAFLKGSTKPEVQVIPEVTNVGDLESTSPFNDNDSTNLATISADSDIYRFPFGIELGTGLHSLIQPGEGTTLAVAVEDLRRRFRERLGIDLPAVKVSINPQLDRRDYRIYLRQIVAAKGSILSDMNFLSEGQRSLRGVEGVDGRHPVTGQAGKWVAEEEALMRTALGFVCHRGQEILLLHLETVALAHAQELLTRSEVQALLDHVHEGARPLVAELIPAVYSLAEVQRILQGLVSEQVSLRDLEKVLEALGEIAIEWPEASRRPVEAVVEKVRNRISRAICATLATEEGVVHALTLDPEVEQRIYEARLNGVAGSVPELAPHDHRSIIQSINNSLCELESEGLQGVILCSPELRLSIKKLLEKEVPTAAVLSYNEIAHGFTVKSGGIVSTDSCSAEVPLTGGRETSFE
ncbi:MAG: hypothetical protein CBC13_09785 [Planctomycetia bacterium TMED53]|nr:MAG: hypothetical protein CBC13_09785 [Planctomycetia bacterium TMED53]